MENGANQKRGRLPIYGIEDELCAAFAPGDGRRAARVIIDAPTGSGKSTQVPQMLLDRGLLDGGGEVLVLQPRRMAARMLAQRVAGERGVRLGAEVGYQVRFEKVVSAETRIRYVTEGIVQRRLVDDANLSGVSAVILDEFHERHLDGDVVLARCLELQKTTRPDLKVVVMSATLGGDHLRDYMGEACTYLRSEGRTFPVSIHYQPSKQRHGDKVWDSVVRAIGGFLKGSYDKGDILVFMPGAYEIRRTIQALERSAWGGQFQVLPLYGNLSVKAQDEAAGGRASASRARIVVATNVAETSLTIEGVTLVVDSGLVRMARFDRRRGIDTLMIEKISQASADQRSGRAGRTCEGDCLRLWSAEDHARRDESTLPEIHRVDLTSVIPSLMAGGVRDVRVFPWYEAPDAEALDSAMAQLESGGIIDRGSGELTELGRQIGQMPLVPRESLVLLEAARQGCLAYFTALIALIQGRDLFIGRGHSAVGFEDYVMADDSSDLQALYRAWAGARAVGFDHRRCETLGVKANVAREIGRMADQFLRVVTRMTDAQCGQDREPSGEEIGRILLAGYSDQVGRRLSATTLSCVVVGNRRGLLDKGSVLAQKRFAEGLFIVAGMTEVEGKEVRVLLNRATRIECSCLQSLFAQDVVDEVVAEYDSSSRRVVARKELRFRDLVLESKLSGDLGEHQRQRAAHLLAREIGSGDLILKKWDHSADQWIARVNTFSRYLQEWQIPVIDEDAKLLIYEEICGGASSYRDIKNRDVKPALKSWLSASQKQALDHMAPERVKLCEDRTAKVIYHESEPPKISVVIQHLFACKKNPALAEGGIPLRVEVLGPNQRPIQVTDDLQGFWQGSYAGVRSQLRGRYPKHAWPTAEDLVL
ncbi:MAG: ATP-dependent helicase HrpB [Verrucomicrobiales bacterium]|nr:ATP-dependent helicase HrpB [Verrucomicrobiales bacterium]